ncbi:MAG: HAMP domain-containing sensor histidine kinase [Desulfuromonadaceae bacterium]|nr:HAMP domain-containing sensor histidine kinase [Desulfuromonadaceae bacterium]
MPRRSISTLILIIAVSLTVGLSWFAIRNFSSASPIAEDNLRGLALTIAAAMEGVAGRDPSLKSLASFQTADVAYAMILSPSGKILFHTNPDLTGNNVGDYRYRSVLKTGTLGEERIMLGTGEYVYEFQTPFHLLGKTCVLRLALHTWRAEAVMRRARFGVALIFSLLALGWGLGITVLWLLRRQDAQEKQLARQNELARLGEVGAVLAHEVRNPLAGIKGYGQLLEERLPEGRERGYAQLIVRESLRLEQLADDILFYTRSDNKLSQSGNLLAVVGQLTTLLTPQLETAGIKLVMNVSENLNVHCPEKELHRLLLNLLTNAIQALPEGGEINVEARHRGGAVDISVADSGTGIETEMRAEIFEPFRTSKARGAGLGLAVCKKIAESCGGSIIAEGAPGGGALFVVRLPAISQEDSV